MRELHLTDEESTDTFYVLRDSDGVRYQVARAEFAPGPDAVSQPAPDAEPTLEPEPVAVPGPIPGSITGPIPAPATASVPDVAADPLALRPKEVQARIRAGATAAELAEETGVPESRIEPYAHPVMLERIQIAEVAKQSHPKREDGPATLTLFEILATAFAARGHSISEATWDATRDPGDEWVVRVTWRTGLSSNEALWTVKRSFGSPAVTEARNAVAADLTDPNFAQPVRSLVAMGPADPSRAQASVNAADQDPSRDPLESSAPYPESEEVAEGDVLRHPEPAQQPQKRRRKAVTPHWEDVLLGVRTNTKRPRQ
ncbi:hypothetical protein CAPI_07680 [Corynebacterium capitovis DSM 44611]|uniref:septation protein SepH n=1 Tax=Corynebacterium capitovis TaxID=131081 RepID=UPI00037DA6D4|nr:septation protein SepH [Corynebacterium capitovis]WKD58072.1 hypothetical protein CAPI_07680 [Corynebacterium capitovis DSM 44611]